MHGHILCKQVEEAGRGGRPNLQQPLNRLIQQPTRFPHWYMLVGQCNPAVPHRATMSVARYRPCSSEQLVGTSWAAGRWHMLSLINPRCDALSNFSESVPV